MAVVKMNKITILGLKKERSSLLESLMKFGVVDLKEEKPDENLDGIYNSADNNEVAEIDAVISDFERAISILDSYVPKKQSLFSARKIISESDYLNTIKQREDILSCVNKINDLEDEITKIKSEENRLKNLALSLDPWINIDIPLNVSETKYTFCLMGTIPATRNYQDFLTDLSQKCPESVVLKGETGSEHHYIAIIAHKSIKEEVAALLRNWGFNRITFNELSGSAREGKEIIEDNLLELAEKRQRNLESIRKLAEKREEIEIVSDGYRMEKARIEAKSKLLSTRSVFVLKGWLPKDHSGKVTDYISKNYFCAVNIEEPAEDEEFPVLLENGPVVESISPVINMYGLPSSREIDPSAITMPFYIFFFGLMLGDGGYGIIIALITAFILKKFRLEDSTRRFIKLLFYCGLATIFAGFLYGSWFGIASLSGTALLISPLDEPELMMSYSILFGIIHMYAGMFMQAINLIRRKQYLDAVFDVLFVYIMNTGFVLLLLPYAPGLSIPGDSSIVQAGKYVFITGVILILLTQGRKSKNIIGKIFGGIPKLYDIIGFFGDCLSYIRILALGLASAIIGDIVNTLSFSFGGMFLIKFIFAALILVVGHIINFALNALGAFVHSCRLQFLEFFGKFLEGGGEPFIPFKAKTKYIIVKHEISKLLDTGAKSRIA